MSTKRFITIGLTLLMGISVFCSSAICVEASEGEKTGVTEETVSYDYKETLECVHDHARVNVDLTVDSRQMPYSEIQVTPHVISSEEARKWTEILFDEETAYDSDYRFTKDTLETQIASLKTLNNRDRLMDEYKDVLAVSIMQSFYTGLITAYEQMRDSAPDEKTRIKTDWQFRPYAEYAKGFFPIDDEDDYFQNTKKFDVVCNRKDGRINHVEVMNRNAEGDDYNNYFAYSDVESALPEMAMTQEEAVSIADDLLKRMGLDGWTIWSAEGYSGGEYLLNYTPEYGSMPVLFGKGTTYEMADADKIKYNNPKISISVSGGVVTRFELSSPMDVKEKTGKETSCVDFDTVYTAFKDYMINDYKIDTYIEFGGEDAEMPHEVTLDVRDAVQGFFRVKEDDQYMLVPAWMFYGEVYVDGASWGTTDLCCVNALDGSLINVTDTY